MPDVGDRARDEFLSEAQEIVEGLGRDLLGLDKGIRSGRVNPGLVNDVFRAVHTLKGLAGLFGANRMATLSHELEELLNHLRLGRVELTAAVLDLLFRSVELYGRILQGEKEGKDETLPEVKELVEAIHKGTGGPAGASTLGPYDLDTSLLAVLTEYEEHRLRTNITQGMRLFRLRVQFQLATIDQALDELKAIAKPHGEIITYLPTGAGADADSIELDILMASPSTLAVLAGALDGRGVDIEEIARRAGEPGPARPTGNAAPSPRCPACCRRPRPRPVHAHPPAPLDPRPRRGPARRQAAARQGTIRSVAQTVRVDIHKLDHLMNIVGELSIVRTSLARLVERLRSEHVERELRRTCSASSAPSTATSGDAAGHPRGAHGAPRAGLRQARAGGPPDQPRRGQARQPRHHRRRDRGRQAHRRGAHRSAHAHDAQRHRSRDRAAHRARGRGQARGGHHRAQRLPEGQPRRHRDRGRRPRDQHQEPPRGRRPPRPGRAPTRRASSPPEVLDLIFIPGLSTKVDVSSSPAAAWAWTSSRPTSASSAASSTCERTGSEPRSR